MRGTAAAPIEGCSWAIVLVDVEVAARGAGANGSSDEEEGDEERVAARSSSVLRATYEWDQKPLLSLILVGLPEMADRISLRRNRSLSSRIHHRLAVGSLVPDDTAEYLRMRLRRAGCDSEIFASEGLDARRISQ